MAYRSPILDLCEVVDDSMDSSLLVPGEYGTGLEIEGYQNEGFGNNPYGKAFSFPVFDEQTAKEMIEEYDRKDLWTYDVGVRQGVKQMDQQRTNYCWAFGVVQSMHLARAKAGLPHVDLSPASAAAPLTNFQNVGGWAGKAIPYIAEHGIAPSDLWPDTAIDRRYDNVESRRHREKYKMPEWWELQPRHFMQAVTACLMGFNPTQAYMHMGHLMCLCRVAINERGEIVPINWNSWGGTKPFITFTGSKKQADEQWCPTLITLSE